MTGFSSILVVAAMLSSDSIVLSNDCGRAEVSLIGAQVVSYVPAGRDDVLFMPKDRDFSRNREMHGGIPVCWPWFGRFGEIGSRMHGLARYERWEVIERVMSDGGDRVVLGLESSEKTRTVWPFDFSLRYTIDLGPKLTLLLEAKNTGTQPFSVTAGFHPYFRVADPAKVRVLGMKEPVDIHPGIDKGFYTSTNGRYLFDTGFSRIEMTAKGECRLIVWNPGPDWPDWHPGCNLDPKGDWRHFVCIEPTITRKDHAVTIFPGGYHAFEMQIAVRP